MAPEIQNNLSLIIETCKKMQVKELAVFGSAARENDYNENSDIDFLVNMFIGDDGLPISDYDYFDLLFALERITGKKVDLVREQGIRNKYFLESVLKDKKVIYEA